MRKSGTPTSFIYKQISNLSLQLFSDLRQVMLQPSGNDSVKGIIGMHRFNFCVVVILLWCENTITAFIDVNNNLRIFNTGFSISRSLKNCFCGLEGPWGKC